VATVQTFEQPWKPEQDEFAQLVSVYLDGSASEEEFSRLQREMACDLDKQRLFVNLNLQFSLLHEVFQRPDGVDGMQTVNDGWFVGQGGSDDDMVRTDTDESSTSERQSKDRFPAPTFPTIFWHGTVGYFSSGWPVAYLVATVVVGIGMLIGSRIPAFWPQQIAKRSSLPSRVAPELTTELVGRITGTVDCQWARDTVPLFTNDAVSLGREFKLESGLVEITYNTGAKAILQGPVAYAVESTNGGFMSIGKLTGKVTTKTAKGFAIRTPTATVTDLGTEFGVEVERDGTCEVHVLNGLVQAKFVGSGGQSLQIVQLKEGEGRRYQRELGQVTAIPLDRAKFERMRITKSEDRRSRWLDYSRQLRQDPALVAYYTFESAGQNNMVLPNMSVAGSVLNGQIEGAEWVRGRLPGKYALYFHGPGSGDKVVLPEQQRFKFTGPFSVAVWFNVMRSGVASQPLVAKGGDSWRLERYSATIDASTVACLPGRSDWRDYHWDGGSVFNLWDDVRYFVCEWDISGIRQPITGAYIQLRTSASTYNSDRGIHQVASLLSPEGIDALTWNTLPTTKTETPLESLGRLTTGPGSVNTWCDTSPATASDLAKLESLRTGSRKVTMLLKATRAVEAREYEDRGPNAPRLVLTTRDANTMTFDTNTVTSKAGASGRPFQITNGRTNVADRRWHLAVAVYEPVGQTAKKRLYIDGCLDAQNETLPALRQNNDPVWLGAQPAKANCEFQGDIDEVAILGRALSAAEVATMFDAGSPASPTHSRKGVTDKHRNTE
jgi:hypothetical protein